MRIAISALAFGVVALAVQPAAAQDDGIVKHGVAAASATAGSMAGTVLGGPVGGALGGVVGGAVGKTAVYVIGSMAARAGKNKKKRKAEVTVGAVEQAQTAEPVRIAAQAAPAPPRLASLPPAAQPTTPRLPAIPLAAATDPADPS